MRAVTLEQNATQVAIGVTLYAGDNNDKVLVARNRSVQNCLNPIEAALAKTVNLIVSSNSMSVWTCPSRPGLPTYEAVYDQWALGYQAKLESATVIVSVLRVQEC